LEETGFGLPGEDNVRDILKERNGEALPMKSINSKDDYIAHLEAQLNNLQGAPIRENLSTRQLCLEASWNSIHENELFSVTYTCFINLNVILK